LLELMPRVLTGASGGGHNADSVFNPKSARKSPHEIQKIARREDEGTDLSQMARFWGAATTPTAEVIPPEGAIARVFPQKNAAATRPVAA
jgi:hypothetical protein